MEDIIWVFSKWKIVQKVSFWLELLRQNCVAKPSWKECIYIRDQSKHRVLVHGLSWWAGKAVTFPL